LKKSKNQLKRKGFYHNEGFGFVPGLLLITKTNLHLANFLVRMLDCETNVMMTESQRVQQYATSNSSYSTNVRFVLAKQKIDVNKN